MISVQRPSSIRRLRKRLDYARFKFVSEDQKPVLELRCGERPQKPSAILFLIYKKVDLFEVSIDRRHQAVFIMGPLPNETGEIGLGAIYIQINYVHLAFEISKERPQRDVRTLGNLFHGRFFETTILSPVFLIERSRLSDNMESQFGFASFSSSQFGHRVTYLITCPVL